MVAGHWTLRRDRLVGVPRSVRHRRELTKEMFVTRSTATSAPMGPVPAFAPRFRQDVSFTTGGLTSSQAPAEPVLIREGTGTGALGPAALVGRHHQLAVLRDHLERAGAQKGS